MMNRALYRLFSVLGCYIARMNHPPSMLAFSSISFVFTNENAFCCNRPSISSFMAASLLSELYLGYDFNSISDGNCSSSVQYSSWLLIFSMSCFKSWSFGFGGICKTDVILNCFNLIPFVTDIILFDIFVTSYGPFHILVFLRYTRTWSPGRIGYLVAGGNLLFNALLIRFSATIVSLSALATCRAEKRSVGVVCDREGAGNDGIIPNISNGGTSLFGSHSIIDSLYGY